MKTATRYLEMRTAERYELVNITARVGDIIAASGIREGLCLVNSMHITSSIFINDEEPGLKKDFLAWLERLAPAGRYHHHLTGEDNGDAHLKRTIMGRECVIAVTGGRLDLGPWEQLFYGEFDGRRTKRVLVKVIGA